MTAILQEHEIAEITGLVQPAAQARKLRELGFIVLGFSARGKVRALAEHPASNTGAGREDRVQLHFG